MIDINNNNNSRCYEINAFINEKTYKIYFICCQKNYD